MSGTNGIKRFLEVNRDGQALNFQTLNATAEYNFATVSSGSTITAAQLLTGQVGLLPGVVSPLNFPNGLEWENAIETKYPTSAGSCIKTTIGNPTNAPLTINLPGVLVTGNPPRTTSMTTCDGTNSFVIAACSLVEIKICNQGPESYMVFPLQGGNAGAGISAIQSVGAGASVVQSGGAPTAFLRSFIGGNGINQVQNANDITFNFDGTNTGAGIPLFVAGVQAAFKSLVAGAGLSLVDNVTSVTLASTTTQQEAYNNSALGPDSPTIQITGAYPFDINTGTTNYGTGARYRLLDADGLSQDLAVFAPGAANSYNKRAARPVNGPAYSTESQVKRNLNLLADGTTVAGFIGSMRSIHHNGNFTIAMYGNTVLGRPYVTDITPSTPLTGELASGFGSWYSTNTHPDDPNGGWFIRNYNIEYETIADNTQLPLAEAPSNGTALTWTHFGENNGISLGSVANIVYPVGAHLAPHRIRKCLGMFMLTNGPLNGKANPAATICDLGGNIKQTIFAGINPGEFDGNFTTVRLLALDVTDTVNIAVYEQVYSLLYRNSATTANSSVPSLLSSVQHPANALQYPPPTLTVPVDTRPGTRVTITNGQNGLAVNRKFLYQIWVERYDIVLLA
jgi:hypothetical protein